MDKNEKKFTTQKEQHLAKMQKFCAYRDRCHSEVRSKLLESKVYGDELEEIMSELIVEGYLNEERYARSYVRGKFRINQWGRNKIVPTLKMKKIQPSLIRLALEEIDEEEYLNVLRQLLDKRLSGIKSDSDYERKQKAIQYALQRGFEMELIRDVLEDIL